MESTMSAVINSLEHHHHQPHTESARLSPRDFRPGDVVSADDDAPVAKVAGRDADAVEAIARELEGTSAVHVTVETAEAGKARRAVTGGGGEGTETVTRLLEGTTVVYVVGEPTESAGAGRAFFKRDEEDATVTRDLEATTVVYVVGDPTETAAASLGEGKRGI